MAMPILRDHWRAVIFGLIVGVAITELCHQAFYAREDRADSARLQARERELYGLQQRLDVQQATLTSREGRVARREMIMFELPKMIDQAQKQARADAKQAAKEGKQAANAGQRR